jgi:N-acetylmuramoyl-L-alanine amidase
VKIPTPRITVRWLAAGAVLAALIGAACGGGDAPPANDTPAATTATRPPTDTTDVAASIDPAALPNAAIDPTLDPETQQDDVMVRSVADGDAAALPNTTITDSNETAAAQEPAPVFTVVLDPGHGGDDIGAVANGINEAVSNLDLARRVEMLLQAADINVVLTRTDDGFSQLFPADRFASGEFADADSNDRLQFGTGRADRQARVDLANQSNADLFVSIHSNAFGDTDAAGVEVWYDPNRDTGAENEQFAQMLLDSVIGELRGYGYPAFDRGILDDSCWHISRRNGQCLPLFVLGPASVIERDRIEQFINPALFGFAPGQQELQTRATNMPAALVELLFVSNDADARVLRDDDGRDAIARGLADAILQYLSMQDATG